jgi:MarR-like DNA-binding transcriptional regulator SgrR of sgrS sRNA
VTKPPYIDTDGLCNEAEEAGMEWADRKAAADALSETRKSVLSQRMASYLEQGSAANKAEIMAQAEASYMDHLERMVEAERQANRARVRYDILRTRIELLRTNVATEREAMRNSGVRT